MSDDQVTETIANLRAIGDAYTSRGIPAVSAEQIAALCDELEAVRRERGELNCCSAV